MHTGHRVAQLREHKAFIMARTLMLKRGAQCGLEAKEYGRESSWVQQGTCGMTLHSGSKQDRQEDYVSWPLGELVSGRLRLVCGDKADGLVLRAFLRRVGRT